MASLNEKGEILHENCVVLVIFFNVGKFFLVNDVGEITYQGQWWVISLPFNTLAMVA